MSTRTRTAALACTIALASGACTPEEGDPSPHVPTPSPRHVVEMRGELVRTFAVPTLAEFAEQPGVVNVIRGRVTKVRPRVSQPGNIVETILTVDVIAQRDATRPTGVEVREQGGLVTVEQVRSDFEGKLGRTLESGEPDEWVDYRFNGIEHARVGDEVLLVVGPDGADDRYTGLARLTRSKDGDFVWPGRAPNPQWAPTVDAATLLD